MKTSMKILSALAIGAAAGTLMGVLFAPDKGTETRKKIKNKGHDIADGVNEKLQSIKDSISKIRVNAKKEMENV